MDNILPYKTNKNDENKCKQLNVDPIILVYVHSKLLLSPYYTKICHKLKTLRQGLEIEYWEVYCSLL